MHTVSLAHRVFKELGSFGAAASACVGAEDFSGAAQNYEADAIQLAASKPDVAEQQLQKAIGNYKKAKDHLQAFELLQRHAQLGPSMSQEVCYLLSSCKQFSAFDTLMRGPISCLGLCAWWQPNSGQDRLRKTFCVGAPTQQDKVEL